MEKIVVNLSIDDYPYPSPYNLWTDSFEMWVLKKLRDVGIPAKGVFKFLGVENGELHRFDNPASIGRISYVWIPHIVKYVAVSTDTVIPPG